MGGCAPPLVVASKMGYPPEQDRDEDLKMLIKFVESSEREVIK
jgi:hypothetical protein